ncbi:MAG: DUF4252 domain-containing protein [Pseudomonadales bacterium]|nr:DUF4252 domain-containing protein [Pseudomonadales bacterium]
MKLFKQFLICVTAVVVIPWALAADNDLQGHPGFVDFSTLTSRATEEPTVEISLKAPLLAMITNLIRAEDEMAADFVSKLLNVTVNVFESDAIDVDNIAESMSEIADNLDDQGWDRVVRVRDDEEHVDIYVRMSSDEELIHGIAVMVASDDETVMINLVGDISGNDVAALGRRFDIDELSDLDVEVN